MGLLPNRTLLLHLLLRLQCQLANQTVNLGAVLFLSFLELGCLGLAFSHFALDYFCQFLLFFLAGLAAVDDFVHEVGNVILECVCDLLHDFSSFLPLFFYFRFQHFQLPLHRLD